MTRKQLQETLKGYEIKALSNNGMAAFYLVDNGIGLDSYHAVVYVYDVACVLDIFHYFDGFEGHSRINAKLDDIEIIDGCIKFSDICYFPIPY